MPIGKTLGKGRADQQQIGNELSAGGSNDITVLDLHSEEVYIMACRIKEKTEFIDGPGTIVGHEDFSIVGGEYTLVGWHESTSYDSIYVYNQNNYFPELFYNDRFIQIGSSTGTLINSDIESGLHLKYTMDDDADNSTIKDSINNYDATLYSNGSPDNTSLHSVEGKRDKALYFDGTDDYAQAQTVLGSLNGALTISMWVYVEE